MTVTDGESVDWQELERRGRARLDDLLRQSFEVFLQVAVGMGATSSRGDALLTGYGCIISAGHMSADNWAALVEAAEGADAESRETNMVFAIIAPRSGEEVPSDGLEPST